MVIFISKKKINRYFLKLELLKFFEIVYINNKKLDDKEIHEVFSLLTKGCIFKEFNSYIESYNEFEETDLEF